MTSANEWGQITVLLSGGPDDGLAARCGQAAADKTQARLNGLFAPADASSLAPWMSDGFSVGMDPATIDSLNDAADICETRARQAFVAAAGAEARFSRAEGPVWRTVSAQVRLSDLVVFDDTTAKGEGFLVETFEQVLMEEHASVLIARDADFFGKDAIVAWDGKEPSSRAARRAVPLLRHAAKVIVAGAPTFEVDPELDALVDYYASRGIAAEAHPFTDAHEIGAKLRSLAASRQAGLIVAGAYGHSRMREFVFGGVTKELLGGGGPCLFLTH